MSKVNIETFLEYFEPIELPVILTEELWHTFDQFNQPLPALLIEEYLKVIDRGAVDEYTEYIPCFRIPIIDNFIAIVYWKAGLLVHEYHLATYHKDGRLIDHTVLCGIKSIGDKIKRSVATIEEDLIIKVVEGISDKDETHFDPGESSVFHFEIFPNGRIVLS